MMSIYIYSYVYCVCMKINLIMKENISKRYRNIQNQDSRKVWNSNYGKIISIELKISKHSDYLFIYVTYYANYLLKFELMPINTLLILLTCYKIQISKASQFNHSTLSLLMMYTQNHIITYIHYAVA